MKLSGSEILLLLVLIAVYTLSFFLVWQNRGAEKIVTTAIPVAVAGLIGIALATFVFGAIGPVSEAFPVAYLLEKDSRLPFAPADILPLRPESEFIMFGIREAIQRANTPDSDVEKFLPAGGDQSAFSQRLYHHVLQRAIIDWLQARYPGHWRMEFLPMALGGTTGYIFRPAPDAEEDDKTQSRSDGDRKSMKTRRFNSSIYTVCVKFTLPNKYSFSGDFQN
jgi:hypothetical protein